MPDLHPFGLVFDPRFLLHDTGMIHIRMPDGSVLDAVDHPSSARIIKRIHALLTGSGLSAQLTPITSRAATIDEVAAFHAPEYIGRLEALSAQGHGEAGEGTPVSAGSFEAALLAAGSTIAATKAVLDGEMHGAFVLARPPGHHAMPEMAMGFCLFNNIVLATLAARRQGIERVMILDWDVHHGNGTQVAFYADPSVLFMSLHQEDWYPTGFGTLAQRGRGAGQGTTLNVPLPAGTGDRGYSEAMRRVIEPAARRFRPELIMVSAGQDASMMDPLGRMLVTMSGFRDLGTHVRTLAEELCDGRLVAVQEGGYSEPYTPLCTLGALEGLSGRRTTIADPYVGQSELARAKVVYTQDTERAIAAAVEAHL